MFFRKQPQKIRTILVDGALVRHDIPEKVYRYSFRASVGVLILGFILLSIPLIQHANTRVFYPTVCLGDWEYPAEAAGEPDGIGYDGSGTSVLTTNDADIFCSEFAGGPPSEEKISRARLTFLWHVGNLSDLAEEPVTEQSVAESEPAVVPTQDETENATEETETVIETPQTEQDSVGTSSQEPLTENETETETALPEESSQTEPETPAAVPQEPAQEISVFFDALFSPVARVYAQEASAEPQETHEAVVSEESVEVGSQEQPTAEEPAAEEAGETENDITADGAEGQMPVVRVSYTLDGSVWNEMGVVTLESWEDAVFEVPVTSWDEIQALQILVQRIEGDAQVPVYLDAVKLSVIYERALPFSPENLFIAEEEMGEIAVPYIPPDVPEYVPKNRIFEREIIVDSEATHSCRAEIFPVILTGTTSTTTQLTLVSSSSSRELLEIGSVPGGIDVQFGDGNGYTFSPKNGEPVEVVITKDNDSQKGSFNVPVIYTAYGDKESAVICQIGITNQ